MGQTLMVKSSSYRPSQELPFCTFTVINTMLKMDLELDTGGLLQLACTLYSHVDVIIIH